MIYPFELTKTTININRVVGYTLTILWLFVGTPIEWIIALSIFAIKGIISSAVLHRRLAHKSYNMNKWVEYFCITIATAGTNSSAISWVAVHRHHHHHSDTSNDPHSPRYLPWKQILLSNFDNIKLMYAKELLKSKFYYTIHKWHWVSTLVIISILFFIDPRAIAYAWLIPLCLQVQTSAIFNLVNHYKFGYRNHNTPDNSYNNIITGLFNFGEGWHNNHHHDPANPNFGNKWWEFDLGYQLIKLIRK